MTQSEPSAHLPATNSPSTNSLAQPSLDWNHQVAAQMQHDPTSFDFFQAIRRIETLAADLPRVGYACQAKHETVRINQTAALEFAPATIDRIDPGHDGRVHLSQRFFGLLGPAGPLPLLMTEQVRNQTRHENNPALESFLNLFHHRMATLFYRSWTSGRGAIQRDRPAEDRFASYVGAISGASPILDDNLGTPQSTDPNATHEATCRDVRLYFAGRFGSSHRNAEGLQAIISETIAAPVKVRSFVLRQLQLQPEDRTVLRVAATSSGRGGRLGQSAVLGRSVPDRGSMAGIEVGPISFKLFRGLLPCGKLYPYLKNLIRNYVDPGMDVSVRLILDHATVPRMSLGRQGTLGRSAWVSSRPPQSDVGDCQFQI